MNCFRISFLFLCLFLRSFTPAVQVEVSQYQLSVLKGKSNNPIIKIKLSNVEEGEKINHIVLNTNGTTDLKDIKTIRLFYYGKDSVPGNPMSGKGKLISAATTINNQITLKSDQLLVKGDNYFWVSYELNDGAGLYNLMDAQVVEVGLGTMVIKPTAKQDTLRQRLGVAVRTHLKDGIHTSRIPGLVTTNKGTLIATFDARRDSGRDLQGNIDIGIHRSEDGGNTWKSLQIAMDMGEWGGLPEKFNGVSDACILVDKNSNAIYIAGLWMHGVINEEGKWLENLTNESADWNHQWKTKGSQPGFGVKETSQFMIVKSTDDGKTWSKPINLTKMIKKEEWWLLAPAPGHGITLKDGTLVFPTQGRDKKGKGFSNITYSKDHGKTWKTSNPASIESTTENMAAELEDGSILLTMRSGANKGRMVGNGRIMSITKDLGETWSVHPTSRNALIEPGCMASLIRHDYIQDGKQKSLLLFSNPDSKTTRNRISIKQSLDNGMSWPSNKVIRLDDFSGRGYSCLTSVNKETIGIFYESSQADIIFQAIKLKDLLSN